MGINTAAGFYSGELEWVNPESKAAPTSDEKSVIVSECYLFACTVQGMG